ncbi:3-oxoacyl-[acyl-carrier-protein] synthase III C-terminal domain-containing protein [Roseateles sp. DB2]|uniref:3-oxoacyl-[acyl-carrier-protein] synthase III C-terminal domain-containing protein n=1 Tax=Roseateles sp. DB2 TaxID=3453717 RepID=UPI003EEF9568
MNEIGIVASSAYVPAASRSLAQLLAAKPPRAASRTARFLQKCFEENLRMHGIAGTALNAAQAGHDAQRLQEATGMTTVAQEQILEASEMLLRVTRELLQPAEGAAMPAASTFLVCHTCLENDVTISAACRLQSEFRQGRVPFAIGQLQGATFLMALSLAADLMATSTDDRVVIAAAERWSWPYTRVVGQTTVLGDGAGAVLMERGCTKGWMLRAIRVQTPPPAAEVYRHIVHGAALPLNLDGLCALISDTLRDAGCSPRDIAILVPHQISRHLADCVRRRCGLQAAWCGPADILDGGYLCAAEIPVRMHRLLQQADAHTGDHMLLWGVGFEGALACAVLEFVDQGVSHGEH